MTKFEIIQELRSWSEQMYWSEDRDINNSCCTSRSYYEDRRAENDAETRKREQLIEELEQLLETK